MNKKFSDMKIKYQFFFLTCMTVILVFTIQTIYYFKIASITTNKIQTFTDQSISQVDEIIKIVFEKATNAATYLAYSRSVQNYLAIDDPYEKFILKKYIDDMVKSVSEVNNEIMNIVLVDPEGKQNYYYTNLLINMPGIIDSMQSSEGNKEVEKGFTYLINNEYSHESVLAYVMPIHYIGGGVRQGKILGYIVILLNQEIINHTINKAANPENIEFYLIDQNEQIIASNLSKMEKSETSKDRITALDKNRNLFIQRKITSTDWNIVAIINETEVARDYAFLKSFALIVGLIILFLIAGLGFTFNRSIAIPVDKLLKEIDKVGRRNLKNRIRMPFKNEVGKIADNINIMLDNLEALSKSIFETQQKMYEIELSKKQSELYVLQSQINPHFLFNTLQCIGGIALSRDLPEVAEVTDSMAQIFQYSIKGRDMVKIQEEVNIVRQYLKIIEFRFPGEFKWDIDIQQEMLQLQTIKMILQPLVENAVYHGLEKSCEEGILKITGWIEEDSVLLEIWDSGPCIEESTLRGIQKMLSDMKELERESTKRQKIGIANIQWRIKLIFGEKYGINIFSGKGEGTTVRVRLPFSA